MQTARSLTVLSSSTSKMLSLQLLPTVPSALRAAAGLVVIALFYFAASSIYLLYFHPLAKYPGPRFAAVSMIWRKKSDASGTHLFRMAELHKQYGDIVRIGPNELSFSNVNAYREIYGHVGQDKKRFLKTASYEREEPRIVSVRDPAEHALQRRALSHAFSARALRDQELVVHQYLDLLLQQFRNLGEDGKKGVNVTNAMNWLTFDIIGDLSFGEPFGAIADASNEWITGILDWVIYMSLSYHMKQSLFLRFLFPIIWGSKLKAMGSTAEKYSSMAKKKADRRLEMGDSLQRADFFGHLIKKKEIDAMYLMGNAQTLIVAGSETTATGLTSTMFWLLHRRECLDKLTEEIRSTFKDVKDITGDSTAECPYLHGIIEESLRLSPPVAIGLPRECPGTTIIGEYIPQGVTVSCENYTIARDPRYWEYPEEFRPERWIGEGFAGDDKKAFQAFSTGPRACLGINLAYLEMRVTLAKMVHVFDLELETQGIEDWNKACKIVGLWQKPDLMIKFIPRQEAGKA